MPDIADPLFTTTFENVAQAHAAIQAAGFSRDGNAHIWRHQDGRTAKAVFVDDSRTEAKIVAR